MNERMFDRAGKRNTIAGPFYSAYSYNGLEKLA